MTAPKKRRREKIQPYGYVIVLRGLARAAIELKDYPATLRVLCVLADYFSAEGSCRFGQATVAARLGMSRQAVNKHLRILEDAGILTVLAAGDNPTTDSRGKTGRTLEYWLNTDGLEESRAGELEARARIWRKRGYIPLNEREGYPAYRAAITEEMNVTGERRPAVKAMLAAEAQLGIRYVEMVPATRNHVAWFARVQPS